MRATYTESMELAKLSDEAELVLKKHQGRNQVHYPWYEIAKELQKKGLCAISEELNEYGRVKWRLLSTFNLDPSETMFQDDEIHQKRVQARRFLIDAFKASFCA